MKKLVIVTLIIVPAILGISCRQAISNNTTSDNQTSVPHGISVSTTQTEMVGRMAPDFHLSDIKGNPVSLSDFRGKPVLLIFWATWSQDSQKEMPIIQQIYDKWQSKGLIVLTIDILNSRPDETQPNVEAFISKNGFSFPVLLDPDQIATIQYHVGETPTNFLIDNEGFIRELTPGPLLSQSAVETSLTRILPQ